MSQQFNTEVYLAQQEHITFAHNKVRQLIHISEAQSGKNGYYCIGCDKELQAKKGTKNIHHFAHDPEEVKKQGRCNYTDESYPRLQAKQLLLKLKKIKVPDLCKYPSEGIQGHTYLLKSAHFVEAHRAESSIRFYEDSLGKIYYKSKEMEVVSSDKRLEIQPDILFFDENNQPILWVQLVTTSKISEEEIGQKVLTHRKIGIDAIMVELPKGSPNEVIPMLKPLFLDTQHTKWLFNKQQQDDYTSVSRRDYPRVLLIDESQKSIILSIESAKCVKVRLRTLIPSITGYLDSEQSRAVERTIRQKIAVVETNTVADTDQWRVIEASIRRSKQVEFEKHRSQLEESFGAKEGELLQSFQGRSAEIRSIEQSKAKLREQLQQYRIECEEKFRKACNQIEVTHRNEIGRIERATEEFRERLQQHEVKCNAESQEEYNRVESKTRSLEAELRVRTRSLEQGLKVKIRSVERVTAEFRERLQQHQVKCEASFREEYRPIEAGLKSEIRQITELTEAVNRRARELETKISNDVESEIKRLGIESENTNTMAANVVNLQEITQLRDRNSDQFKQQYRTWNASVSETQSQTAIDSELSYSNKLTGELGRKWRNLQTAIESADKTIQRVGSKTLDSKIERIEREQKGIRNAIAAIREQQSAIDSEQTALRTALITIERARDSSNENNSVAT